MLRSAEKNAGARILKTGIDNSQYFIIMRYDFEKSNTKSR